MASVLHVILIVLIVVVVLMILISLFLAVYTSVPKKTSYEESIKEAKEQNMYGDYDELEKEPFTVRSYDGYELSAELVKCGDPKRIVIISHGWGVNRYNSVKYVQLFRKFGYSAVVYDDRGHGVNKSTYTTMGIRESKDLLAVIDAVYERYGSDVFLGLHGESLGASLSVLALGEKPNVRFLVSDCGYGDFREMCRIRMVRYHLPMLEMKGADLFCRWFYHYSPLNVFPYRALEDNIIPIAFMHGTADYMTDHHHSILMHEKNKGYSELHLYPDTPHARSLPNNPEAYEADVRGFLKDHVPGGLPVTEENA